MAAQYLLPCKCGSSLPVSQSQAGGHLRCSCGAELEVPTLRGLRDLEQVEVAQEQGAAEWGLRQGILTVGILVSLLLGGGAAWFAANEPAPPESFDIASRANVLDTGIENLTPDQAWTMWKSQYEPLAVNGFYDREPLGNKIRKQNITQHQLYRNILGIAAGGVLLLSLLAYALLPR